MTVQPGTYKHYKGDLYLVIGTARHTETGETLVAYKALYPLSDLPQDTIFVRPIKMFFEEVEINGTIVPRFSYNNDTNEKEL